MSLKCFVFKQSCYKNWEQYNNKKLEMWKFKSVLCFIIELFNCVDSKIKWYSYVLVCDFWYDWSIVIYDSQEILHFFMLKILSGNFAILLFQSNIYGGKGGAIGAPSFEFSKGLIWYVLYKDIRGQSWSSKETSADQPGLNPFARGQRSWQIFFSNFNFDLWYFCSTLTKINV